eukprot:m.146123 g.146123  ORF g.146123 m.146123 type:complete len:452 (-) comp30469_c0_seq1:98-1453(-)
MLWSMPICMIFGVLMTVTESTPSATLLWTVDTATVSSLFNLVPQFQSLSQGSMTSINFYKVRYNGTRVGLPLSLSQHYNGDAGLLSGVLVLPIFPSHTPSHERPVTAFLHGTVTDTASVPSRFFDRCISTGTSLCLTSLTSSYGLAAAIGAATFGFASVLPDGIGQGDDTGSAPPPYLIAEAYGISTFGLHLAASQVVSSLVDGYKLSTTTLIPCGYSEGGYGALAVHRLSYAWPWRDADVYSPWVPLSLPSAGPYSLLETQFPLSIDVATDFAAPSYFAYVAASYGGFLNLATTTSSQALLTTITSWFDGSKTSAEIDALVNSMFGSDPLGMFNATETHAIVDAVDTDLTRALRQNSLTEGWDGPVLPSTTRLCHGEADDVVFVENAHAITTTFVSTSTLITINSSLCSSHTGCALSCLVDTLDQLRLYVPRDQCELQTCARRRGRRPAG